MSELKKREEIKEEFKWKVEKIYTYKKSGYATIRNLNNKKSGYATIRNLNKHNQEHFHLL
jgi:hypothetical protein